MSTHSVNKHIIYKCTLILLLSCLGTVQDCRSSEEEFRKAQCAMTDSIPMNGQRHHWVPVNMLGKESQPEKLPLEFFFCWDDFEKETKLLFLEVPPVNLTRHSNVQSYETGHKPLIIIIIDCLWQPISFMATHLVRAQSTYKDIGIRSFCFTHSDTRTHTHTLYWRERRPQVDSNLSLSAYHHPNVLSYNQ